MQPSTFLSVCLSELEFQKKNIFRTEKISPKRHARIRLIFAKKKNSPKRHARSRLEKYETNDTKEVLKLSHENKHTIAVNLPAY